MRKSQTYHAFLLLVAILLLSLLVAGTALANTTYFQQIPAGFEKSCNLCHTTPPQLNDFGQKFKAAGFKFPAAKEEKAPAAKEQGKAPAAPAKEEAKAKPAQEGGNKAPAKQETKAARPATPAVDQFTLVAGDKQFKADGLISGGKLFVAVRPLASVLGGQVNWQSGTATLAVAGKQLVVKAGSAEASLGGQAVKLDASARLVKGQLLLPVRPVATALGYTVSLEGKTLRLQAKPAQPAASTGAVTVKEAPRRGCAACHVGKYSLINEAKERAEVRGGEHPTADLNGKPMDDKTTAATCLTCHKPGPDGKGYAAPYSLRDIVHPAHMGSATFKERYNGTCFTCHNVDGNGNFVLLTEKVEVNEKGIPNVVPIPGAVAPSER